MTLRAGWLVALFALIVSVSVWLPWLTTRADGGGHASAIGGAAGSLHLPPGFGVGQSIALLAAVLLVAGAMAARGLFGRLASIAALVISAGIAGLIGWYCRLNVGGPIGVGYGLYIGVGGAVGALGCSLWALIAVLRAQ